MEIVKCKSCGADCYWIKTTKDKPHLVNANKKKVFVKAIGSIHPKYQVLTGYESHFSTCPQAAQWRKKK